MRKKTIRISPEYSDIDDIMKQYHFNQSDRPRINSIYRQFFSKAYADIYYAVNPDIAGIDEESFAVAVVTLGRQMDELASSYLEAGLIMDTYMLDALAMKIMTKAYVGLVQSVTNDTGMTVRELSFLGDRYGMELMPEILEVLSPCEVTCNDAYMLTPLKSVCLVLPLKKSVDIITSSQIKAICHTCFSCKNTDCAMRR